MSAKPCRRWIAVTADLLDHPIVGLGRNEIATTRDAWLWMIAKAAFAPHKTKIGKHATSLERAQLVVGRDFLAKEWRWKPHKVRYFLKKLQKAGMIEVVFESSQRNRQLPAIITICNYEKYQNPNFEISQQIVHHSASKPPYITRDTKEPKKEERESLSQSSPEENNPPELPSRVSTTQKHAAGLQRQRATKSMTDAQRKMVAALSSDPDAAYALEAVKRLPGGRIDVFNGFRQECLDIVGGNERILRLRLNQAYPYVKDRQDGIDLMVAVRASLSKSEEWLEKDARWKKGVNGISRPASDPSNSIRELEESRKRDEKMGLVSPRR